MAKKQAKEIARKLYMQGVSQPEIAKHSQILQVNAGKPVSKSSVSLWTRDLTRPPEVAANFSAKRKAANVKTAKILRQRALDKRLEWQRQGKELFQSDETFRAICALYWAEGTKCRNTAALANTDHHMLVLFAQWLNSYDVFWTFKVHYYSENNTEENIKAYWKSVIPSLTDDKFRKFQQKTIADNRPKTKTSNAKNFKRHPYGVATLKCNSTHLRQLIEGGILKMKEWIEKGKYNADRI